ncbi:unnamed protein product [Effrenium voratum]|nr:unnamed protein product [Effrenium voratum]
MQNTTPDFLLPCLLPLDKDPGPAFTAPMSYFQALSFVRWALQTPWLHRLRPSYTDRAFTLRSLKTCLLSASAQLRLPEDSRRLQGHHKLSSAQLYSRDDTIEALWLQRQLSTAARGGWRPPRPQARGGQHPTIEPPFVLPGHAMPEALCLAELEKAMPSFLYSREIAALSQPGTTSVLDSDEEATAVLAFALDQSNSESESSSGAELDTGTYPLFASHAKRPWELALRLGA